MSPIRTAIADASTWILATANPAMSPAARATATWPVMPLESALSWCAFYAVIVSAGLIRKSYEKKGAVESDASSSTLDAVVKQVQIVYNFVQVVLCAWMMTAALVEAQKVGIAVSSTTLVCNAFNPKAQGIAFVLWVFYLSKILDFCDTLFMVLRGKWNQFSFLHVYHHFSIFMTYWLVTSVGYDGDVYYTIVANSFIHLAMYLYYFLTSFDFKPTWGKYMTQMQMFQFVTMNVQACIILFRPCPYPHPVTWFYLVYIVSLLGLFLSFYLKRWTEAKPKAQ